ncbi:stromelysin-1-like [Paroedura picta]|uniref:stromelysin-1-like n=1 Tax=Paroedura picta TaxID=143630 RepID=UPI0040579864
MKSLLLIIVLCKALSSAWPVLPNIEQAIEKDAQFFKEEHSGTLNKIRRCIRDVSEYNLNPDFARWKNRVVTYRISNYTQKLPHAAVDEIFKKAFGEWSKHTCLKFIQSRKAADIDILFGSGVHAEDCPFDEENGVLAHAYSSSKDGNEALIHFDDDENWTEDYTGINLFNVAVHEIGHILGLSHSNYSYGVMNAEYDSSNASFRLHPDDIAAVQVLNGKPGNCSHWPQYPAPPSNIPPEEDTQPFCEHTITFDDVTTFQGRLLFFKGEHILRDDPGNEEFEHLLINDLWPILRCGIDAVYEVENVLYLIKEMRYWTFNGDSGTLSSSQLIYTLYFLKITKSIDAAVHDPETKTTLVFIGKEYWSFNEETSSMEEGYPRKIAADFPEIGSKVDAAFQYNGHLYLFSGPNQYEFDPRNHTLIDIKKTNTWFGCEE